MVELQWSEALLVKWNFSALTEGGGRLKPEHYGLLFNFDQLNEVPERDRGKWKRIVKKMKNTVAEFRDAEQEASLGKKKKRKTRRRVQKRKVIRKRKTRAVKRNTRAGQKKVTPA